MNGKKLNIEETEKIAGGRNANYSGQKFYVNIVYKGQPFNESGCYIFSYYDDGAFLLNCNENTKIRSMIATLIYYSHATGIENGNFYTYRPGGDFKLYFVDDGEEVTYYHDHPNNK